MNKQMKPTNRGIDVVLSIGDKVIGGQQNCILNRGMSAIDITNKIDNQWQEIMAGTKTWSVLCSGLYVKDEDSFTLLEQSFADGMPLDIKLSDGNRIYEGRAFISNFPAEAKFNSAFAYNINLTGTGPLR